MKSIFCLILAILFYPSILVFGNGYPIQNFTPKDYKAGIQNIDFAQNRDMTLLVANNLGVLSYNGNDWAVHASRSGKKKRSLAFDENTNRLYVGAQGEFGYFNNDWKYVSLLADIPPSARDFDEVWDIFLLHSKVYFCTFQGIYVYDGTSISVIDHENGLERSFLASGKLFTQDPLGKLFEVKGLELVSAYQQSRNHELIAGIIPQNEGFLLFYKSGEIEFSTSFGVTAQYEDLSKSLQGTYVNHVLQLSDARLVISTQTSGLFLYDLQKRSLERITAKDGLQSNACLRAFQDYSGNLWVGLQNGIALIDINAPMRFINQDIQLQGSGYEAFEVEEGTYFSTSNGIYFLAKEAAQCIFLPGTEGPAYGLQKIAGKLYAGHHTGLFLLEKGTAKRLALTDGLWSVKQLRSNPEFAIGGTYSGLFLFQIDKNLTLQALQKIGGFNESSRFFEEDHLGRIWVGQFYKGLYQLQLTEGFTEANVQSDFGIPLGEQILVSRIDNELYFATNAGLFKLDRTTDRIVREETFSKDLGEQQIHLIAQDQQKNIHVLAENAIGFFKPVGAANYAFVRSSLFQWRYSLNNDLLQLSIHTRHGVLFNANEGFIQFHPEQEDRMTMERPLLISQVFSVSEDSTLYAQNPFEAKPGKIDALIISPKAKVLQFEVESFQFNQMNHQEFRYFLKGFDTDFGEWTDASTKEYTNLKEGQYAFIFQTRNYLGEAVSSEPLLLNVKPPFHRGALAKVLYVILGILTLFLVSRFQKMRYSRKTQAVKKSSQLELAAKQEKLVEIEQQKERELLQLKEERIKSELRHLNNLLATSTMNLVVKNEFIETIKEKLQEVGRKGKSVEVRQALEQIVSKINFTLRLQEDWEQFEHHFELVHGEFLTRLRNEFHDLSPNEQKLCAFLRLNLSTKEIANLMGVSHRGIEVARYRLRKKLNLDKGQNLSKFILEY